MMKVKLKDLKPGIMATLDCGCKVERDTPNLTAMGAAHLIFLESGRACNYSRGLEPPYDGVESGDSMADVDDLVAVLCKLTPSN